MSDQARYRALNEQVFRSQQGAPLRLHVEGRDRLDTVHHDVMLEAAATSFQVHLRGLLMAYMDRQRSGRPVHKWDLE